FSSRRRHTRFSRDWSSDVCSSDLVAHQVQHIVWTVLRLQQLLAFSRHLDDALLIEPLEHRQKPHGFAYPAKLCLAHLPVDGRNQIGRASCRESVQMTVVCIYF